MNKVSGKKKISVVKIFINTLACAILFWGSSGFAISDEQDEKNKQEARLERERQTCIDERNQILEAEKEIGEACKRAGLGEVSGCVSRAKMCGETSSSDSFNNIGSFAKAFGIDGLTSIGSACPQMNGRDYFTEKEKLEKDIKDTEKELADLNDDKAEIEDDYNKEVQEIQKTLTEAQEDFKKKKLEIAQSDRERVSDFMNTQNQTKEELRKEGEKVIQLRGQLIQSQRKKVLEMIAMSEAAGKRACLKAVKDAKKAYESVSSGKSASHISQAKKKRADLIKIYEECMDGLDQQRIALNESYRTKHEELNKQIDDTQEKMNEIQNSLNLANSQLEEMKEAASKEEADALQSVIDLGQRSQQQMKDAYDKMQKKLQTLAAKNQSLQAALNRINQSLMTLGPAPKRSAEDTIDEASSTISAQVDIIENIKNSSVCPNIKDEKLKRTGSSKGRR